MHINNHVYTKCAHEKKEWDQAQLMDTLGKAYLIR